MPELRTESRVGKSFDRVIDALQVSLREVEINGRRFQIDMTEQNLDGLQIGPTFQQMSRPTVPQRVRGYLFLYTCASGGLSHGIPYRFRSDRWLRPIAVKTREQIDLGFSPSPIGAQQLQQSWRQRHITILVALALANVDH